METPHERFIKRLQLYNNLMCEREFSAGECKACEYYYMRINNMYKIPMCLKEQIRMWAVYRISKGE